MKKYVLQALTINEFSGVDFPAQEGATVALLKRNHQKETVMTTPEDQMKKAADLLTSTNQDLQLKLTKAEAQVVELTKKFEDIELTKKREVEDVVLYTTSDGMAIRKSMDPSGLLADMAKSRDEERAGRETEQLMKRCEKEIGHLPGEPVVKVALLRAINQVKDETVRKGILETLAAADAVMATNFVAKGKGSNSAGNADKTPLDRLDALAKSYAAANKVGYHDAYDAVLSTDEGRSLYSQASS